MIEIIISSIPVFIGAGSAFLLNYLHEQGKIKEKEIIKSREFLSRLLVVLEAAKQYEIDYLNDNKDDWKVLPLYFIGLIPENKSLKVEEISFCNKTEKCKGFYSTAIKYELNIERINNLLKKHTKATEKIENEIQVYLKKQGKDNVNVNVKELNFKEILGVRKTKEYKHICQRIIKQIPQIYETGMMLKKQHLEIMNELYPNEEHRDFEMAYGMVLKEKRKENKPS